MSWEWMGTPAVPRLNESTLCDALNVLGARKSGTSDGVLIVGDSLAGQLYATLLGLFKGPRLCGGIARVDFRRNDFLTIGTGPQAAQQAVRAAERTVGAGAGNSVPTLSQVRDLCPSVPARERGWREGGEARG